MNPQQQPGDPVKHVVLLMFENHSFDQMLGCLKEVYSELDGVDPKKPRVNQADGKEFRQAVTTERQMILDPRQRLIGSWVVQGQECEKIQKNTGIDKKEHSLSSRVLSGRYRT
jgi:phospholipase C